MPAAGVAVGTAGASISSLFTSRPTPKCSRVLTQARVIESAKNKAPAIQVPRTMKDTPPEAPKKPAELPEPKAEPMPPSFPCCSPTTSRISTSASIIKSMVRNVAKVMSSVDEGKAQDQISMAQSPTFLKLVAAPSRIRTQSTCGRYSGTPIG